MIEGLAGRGAIVTGAGQGIGRATAVLLARVGMAVGCLDVNGGAAAAVASEIETAGGEAQALVADVVERDNVRRNIDDYAARHGLAVLVNNAMWIRFEEIGSLSEPYVDRMLAVGVKGILWCTEAALTHLARAAETDGDAAIINVASAAAFQGTPGRPVYSAVKGAVVGMTRELAVELGPRGVRVNAVAPGPILTEGARETGMDPASPLLARSIARTPLGRLGTSEEVAQAIALLASPISRWITGQVVVVDGGRAVSAL
jgi:3-oxoacyl-[acyl-carrier protein] reductase